MYSRTYCDSKTTCFNAHGGRKKLVSLGGRSELSEQKWCNSFLNPPCPSLKCYTPAELCASRDRQSPLTLRLSTLFLFFPPHSICSYSTCISMPHWLSICFYNLYLSHLLMALKIYNRGRKTLGMSASTCSSHEVFTLMLSVPACRSISQTCPYSSRAALDCF